MTLPAADPTSTRSPVAVGLAATGCVAAFYGATHLLTHQSLDVVTLAPLVTGTALIAIVLVQQYRARHPLLTVRPLTSTLPVAGIVAAMSAAAASVSAIALTGVVLQDRYSPVHLGLVFLPEFGGAVITALVFAAVFTTRGLHYFALTGLIFLSAGIALIAAVVPPTTTFALVGTALIGVGSSAPSVPTALFIAGFSLHNVALQRVFAIIELLRAVAAFMIAPILLYVAATVGNTPVAGVRTALWVCLGLSGGGALLAVSLYGARRSAPARPGLGSLVRRRDSVGLAAAARRATSQLHQARLFRRRNVDRAMTCGTRRARQMSVHCG